MVGNRHFKNTDTNIFNIPHIKSCTSCAHSISSSSSLMTSILFTSPSVITIILDLFDFVVDATEQISSNSSNRSDCSLTKGQNKIINLGIILDLLYWQFFLTSICLQKCFINNIIYYVSPPGNKQISVLYACRMREQPVFT